MIKSNYPLYLGNQPHETGQWLSVDDKYRLKPVSQVALADDAVLNQAIELAQAALKPLRQFKVWQRQAVLSHAARRFEQRLDELTEILIVEGGKPFAMAQAEVKRLISTFDLARDAVTTLPRGEVMALDVTAGAQDYRGMVQRVPIGICSFISPFNFPLNLTAHKVAPAIAAGCPFILKPASLTPISALIMGEVLAETDLPAGSFSILPCERSAADRLVTDERLNLLSFTGSDAVGWDMKARAGKKKVVLELGGNAAVIIEPDTPLDAIMPRLLTGCFGQSGQVCISVQRILVHEQIYDALKSKLVNAAQSLPMGDPKQPETVIGPMIRQKESDRLKHWIEEAIAEGATVLCGNQQDGVMLSATVMENVNPESALYHNEAFGPVVILESYQTFSEAIGRVNQSRFGLQVGVYTQNLTHTLQAWDELEVGGVIINDVPTFRVDNMPYGGVKDSGLGREGIAAAMTEMTEPRLLVIKT